MQIENSKHCSDSVIQIPDQVVFEHAHNSYSSNIFNFWSSYAMLKQFVDASQK